jgi:hypothetical protein
MTVAGLKRSNFSLKMSYTGCSSEYMARPSIREYQIKRANVPNGDKMWYIVGRPNRTRIRAWFKTKEAAQAEATERNLAMRKRENAVALDAVLRDGARRSDSLKAVWEDSQGRNRLLPLLLDRTSILHLRPRTGVANRGSVRSSYASRRNINALPRMHKGHPREVRREIRERVNRLSERR